MNKKHIEKTYGNTLKGIMFAVNPIKRIILKTYCTVHKFINLKAINILYKNNYKEEYDFFRRNVKMLNQGTVWADQDFKSSNHFYSIKKGRGLYGFSDSLTESKKYYSISLKYLRENNLKQSFFYLGSTCHLIQDSTVPQHASNELLKSHRNFELWIIKKLMDDYTFEEENEILRFKSLDQYIKNNAKMAYATYQKYSNIKNKDDRYLRISKKIISEAQKTTAGFLLDYYDEYKKIYNIQK